MRPEDILQTGTLSDLEKEVLAIAVRFFRAGEAHEWLDSDLPDIINAAICVAGVDPKHIRNTHLVAILRDHRGRGDLD